jgi:DnaK suppressor protein
MQSMTGGDMEQSQSDQLRAALEAERDHVERQLAEHGVPADGENVEVSVDEGFADSAQATAERSQLMSIIERIQDHRVDVLAALKRMDEGVYGKCERCGQAIPFERLEAVPTASLCVSCKQATGAG